LDEIRSRVRKARPRRKIFKLNLRGKSMWESINICPKPKERGAGGVVKVRFNKKRSAWNLTGIQGVVGGGVNQMEHNT